MPTIPQDLANEALGWLLVGALTIPERRAEVVAWADEWLTALEQTHWPPELATLSLWGLHSEQVVRDTLVPLSEGGDEAAAVAGVLARAYRQLRLSQDPYAFVRYLYPLSFLSSEQAAVQAVVNMVDELEYALAVRGLPTYGPVYLDDNERLAPVSAQEFGPQLLQMIEEHLRQLPAPFRAILQR